MPRNGSGSYTLPTGNPFIPSTVISSTTMNNTMSDIGTALTQSIANDGQTTPVANLPMATFRHTNVGNAQARNEYAAAGQVQDGSLMYLTAVAGTDTITATITPSPAAYAAGQTFRFVAAGTNTTAVPTLNINGLGAKNLTKNGAKALAIGDLLIGAAYEVTYDGTQFQVISVPAVSPAIVGDLRGGSMVLTAASASGTYSAKQIILNSALGGSSVILPNYSKTVNLATTGAGGMDTGTAPVSGYVALYAIYNQNTGASSILGTNANSAVGEVYGGANMPSGYTHSALIAVLPTNGSSQMVASITTDRFVAVAAFNALTTNSQTSNVITSLSVSGGIPANARTCCGLAYFNNNTSNSALNISLYGSSSATGLGQKFITGQIMTTGGNNVGGPYENLQITTSQTIYYATFSSTGTPTFTILINGYTF